MSVAVLLVACGPSTSHSGPTDPLRTLSLQPGDMPGAFVRCDRLSGQYPGISSAYLNSRADGVAWQSILTAGASDAWVEIYGRGNGACEQYRTASDPVAYSGGIVQAIVIKYRTSDAATTAFGSGQFIPAFPAGFMNPGVTVLYGTSVRGTATGQGPNSYLNAGTFGTYAFLHAAIQNGPYVLTLFAENVPADVGRQLLPVLDGRLTGTPRATPTPTPESCNGTSGEGSGSISGDHLSFPGSGIPALRIYAISIDAAGTFCFTTTVANQRSFTIAGLPSGQYDVIAYRVSGSHQPGAYTNAVPCGLAASCTDHSLLPVLVHDGQAVTGINPNDWHATSLPPEPHS